MTLRSLRFKIVLAALVLAFAGIWLAGCAQDLARPETIEDRIAYTEAGLTSAYTVIGDLKRNDRISADRRDQLVAEADHVGAILDASRSALSAGDPATATSRLELARDALTLLQATLRGLRGAAPADPWGYLS